MISFSVSSLSPSAQPHTDYFHDQVNQDKSKGGQRIATVLMYLSTPDEGGETVFPSAKNKVNGTEWSATLTFTE
jgi:prolyl 4-hydroxylase